MKIDKIIAAGHVMPVIVIDGQKMPPLGKPCWKVASSSRGYLRTPAALDAIEAMAKACPELLVGAGTVMTTDHARQVRDAGGCFAVSPGATDVDNRL